MVKNESWSCVLDYDHVRKNLITIPLTAIILVFLELLILCGNGLVVAAVVTHRSLQTTTNYIITSLAFSDLALGMFVLPFSIWKEITHVWGFGDTVCNMWLAMDVWLCTASIYNVVAISFDRFMAVTQPLKYKLVKSSKIGRILVSLSWVLSFAISLPPLVIRSVMNGPQKSDEEKTEDDRFWTELSGYGNWTWDLGAGPAKTCDCTPANNSDGYIIYSAMGSFIVPLIFILVFNGGIYKAVLAASATITVQVSRSGRRRTSAMILRVHRGGDSCCTSQQYTLPNPTYNTNKGDDKRKWSCNRSQSPVRGKGSNQLNKSLLFVIKKPSSLSLVQSNQTTGKSVTLNNNYNHSSYQQSNNYRGSFGTAIIPYVIRQPPESPGKPFFRDFPSPLWTTSPSEENEKPTPTEKSTCSIISNGLSKYSLNNNSIVGLEKGLSVPSFQQQSQRNANNSLIIPTVTKKGTKGEGMVGGTKLSCSSEGPRTENNGTRKKPVSNGGTNSSSGFSRERAEQRVAKTVAIVVGCYLICWMPFAVVYLLQAYDTCTIASQCIPSALFTTIVWLGYANSALNPIIYALFSRDFRRAFKRVLISITPAVLREMFRSATGHSRQNSRSTLKPSLLPTYQCS